MEEKKKNIKDPHVEREAQKYAKPIASREFILDLLKKLKRPLTYEQLIDALHLHDDDQLEALRRRLGAMVRDGQLLKNRRQAYGLVDKMDLIPGKIQAHKEGFGFFIPEQGGEDLFLHAREMRLVMHGDRVLARVKETDQRGRKEGTIVEVLERVNQYIVGRFFDEDGVCFVIPNNKNFTHDILIPLDRRNGAKNGQIVQLKIIAHPDKRRQAIGEVMKIVGDYMGPGTEIDIALLAYNIPYIWPESVLAETNLLTPEVDERDKKTRRDIRELPLVTIDGEDARDFDDAVFCEPLARGQWRLVVAIADVSHYVQPETALDIEAKNRGNSVYFPERVIPMLPEILSNELCSLKPAVDRLCMVCDMRINSKGKITSYEFYDAVMHSKARLTYNKVHRMIEGDGALAQEYAHVLPHIINLYELYQVLRAGRVERGALDFDSTESRIVFGDNLKIEKIIPVVRNEAHMLIEEAMLAANVCTAEFLAKHHMPTLYRIHEKPKTEKLLEIRRYLSLHGLTLGLKDEATPKDYQVLLELIRSRPDSEALQTMVLRSMNQAQYSPNNEGHFGLAYEAYAHFTSPIRRYPDLLVHRAIRHVLAKQKAAAFCYNASVMQQFAEHCSMTERRADEATRDAVSWLKCEYMTHHLGEIYQGKITGVTAFGLFVQLDDVYVEGLVHVTALKDDYYRYDEVHYRLLGERTRTIYRLGDRLSIRVLRADCELRQIDFELAETTKKIKKKRK